eukprot:scaffold113803_cov18-Tisochrysis_lutea.AAC.2
MTSTSLHGLTSHLACLPISACSDPGQQLPEGAVEAHRPREPAGRVWGNIDRPASGQHRAVAASAGERKGGSGCP